MARGGVGWGGGGARRGVVAEGAAPTPPSPPLNPLPIPWGRFWGARSAWPAAPPAAPMPPVAAGDGRRKRRRRCGGGGGGGGGGSRTSERAGMAECGACARPRREARRDCLPLCEACGERFDRRAPDEFFLAAYAAPAFVLRARGAVLEPLLEPLMLPAPRGPPSQASADEVLRPLLALDGASPPPPLLVLLGSGASAAYGVRPNYGPGDAEGDASLGVNERYWRVSRTAQPQPPAVLPTRASIRASAPSCARERARRRASRPPTSTASPAGGWTRAAPPARR